MTLWQFITLLYKSIVPTFCFHLFCLFLFICLLRYDLYTVMCIHLKCTVEFRQMYIPFPPAPHTRYTTFPSPKRVPSATLQSAALDTVDKHWFDFYHYKLVLPVLERYINEIIGYVLFCAWLFSLSIMFLRFIHPVFQSTYPITLSTHIIFHNLCKGKG